ncbi:hypothetical protein RHMOL_Rhmol12G0205700 [Rhododendron molle]|uniref:Uncharacterized protein n=1 Tax=Rhododendron molle TaxID=49168 RepID=A0ACC0LLK6_RHOML|nr:hypothetical protein RHMOL_Rhmol12G0205700 [Rhododendron molle]
MDNRSWENSASAGDNDRGTFDLGSFTRLLETGIYPENYQILNSENGANELPNYNYRMPNQQSNEEYENDGGFENMAWVNRFATTGQGDAGPSDNVPRGEQFLPEYNCSPHLYASSDFRHSYPSGGQGNEAQPGYDNWEWMNNNNGQAGPSTNVVDEDGNSEYSIPADEFYAEYEDEELRADLLSVALALIRWARPTATQRSPERLPPILWGGD